MPHGKIIKQVKELWVVMTRCSNYINRMTVKSGRGASQVWQLLTKLKVLLASARGHTSPFYDHLRVIACPTLAVPSWHQADRERIYAMSSRPSAVCNV